MYSEAIMRVTSLWRKINLNGEPDMESTIKLSELIGMHRVRAAELAARATTRRQYEGDVELLSLEVAEEIDSDWIASSKCEARSRRQNDLINVAQYSGVNHDRVTRKSSRVGSSRDRRKDKHGGKGRRSLTRQNLHTHVPCGILQDAHWKRVNKIADGEWGGDTHINERLVDKCDMRKRAPAPTQGHGRTGAVVTDATGRRGADLKYPSRGKPRDVPVLVRPKTTHAEPADHKKGPTILRAEESDDCSADLEDVPALASCSETSSDEGNWLTDLELQINLFPNKTDQIIAKFMQGTAGGNEREFLTNMREERRRLNDKMNGSRRSGPAAERRRRGDKHRSNKCADGGDERSGDTIDMKNSTFIDTEVYVGTSKAEALD